jgi:hypothetical protein
MRWFLVLAIGAAIALFAARSIISTDEHAADRARRFCEVLRAGQPWDQLAARLAHEDFAVTKVSPQADPIELYRVSTEAHSHVFACTVSVERGHVRDAHFSKLPR